MMQYLASHKLKLFFLVLAPFTLLAAYSPGRIPSPISTSPPIATELLTSTPTQIQADQAEPLELVGYLGGTATAVNEVGFYNPARDDDFEVVGDYVYMAVGQDGLRVIDISDPAMPAEVGQYQASGSIDNVTASSNYIIISLNHTAVRVLDISTPTNPLGLGTYQAPDEIMDIEANGNYIYLAVGRNRMQVVDVSIPTAPIEAVSYDIAGYGLKFIVVDNHIYYYVFRDAGIQFIDITNPMTPKTITTLDDLSSINYVTIKGQDIYFHTKTSLNTGMLGMIDISNPTTPTLVKPEDAYKDALQTGPSGKVLAVTNKYLFYTGDYISEVEMIDISVPTRPVVVGSAEANQPTSAKLVGDDYLYVTTQLGELFIFRINPTSVPRPTVTVNMVGHLGGSTNAVFVQDNYAYIGFGPEMTILDIADPTQPRQIGYLLLPSSVQDIFVVGSYAYVIDSSGWWRVDVSDPTQPFKVDRSTLCCIDDAPIIINDVALAGQYAYLTQLRYSRRSGSGNVSSGYFKIIDVSDPAHPLEVGTFATSGGSGTYNTGAREVQIVDNYAYVADSEYYGLRVFDVSNPAEPIEVGNSGDGAEDMVIRDGYAYITNGYWGGFRVIDVSDPTTLNTLDTYDTLGRTWDIVLKDDYAYVAEDPLPQGADPPKGDYGLRILDLSDPINLTANGFYTTSTHITDLDIVGDHLYLTTHGALRILDISEPSAPVEIGAYETLPAAYDLRMIDTYAYIITTGRLDNQGVSVPGVNFSKPAIPAPVNMVPGGFNHETPIVDGYAYLNDDSTLRILDVSDPAAPVEVGIYQASGRITQVVVGKKHAYATVGLGSAHGSPRSLVVIDVSKPSTPTEIGKYELLDGVRIAIVGDYLYMLNSSTGLDIVDISDPRALVKVRTDQNIAGSYLVIHDGYAYLGTSTGLQIVDISNPANPVAAGATGFGIFGTKWSFILNMAIDDNYAYLADSGVGLRVIDISNPAAPVEAGFFHLPGRHQGLSILNDRVYFTAEESGLFIFQINPLVESDAQGEN